MDTRHFAGAWLFALAALAPVALATWAPAAAVEPNELLEPLRPSADVEFNPAACQTLPAPGAVSGAHLVAGRRPSQVGPYTVMLDSLANPDAQARGENPYRPILIEADAGTALRIDLDNKLPASDAAHPGATDTNLHTHGLIVSARPYDPHRPCPGDSVYQSVPAAGAERSLRRYRIDVPAAIPAAFFGLGPSGTVAHPSGLFWFHAHLHTLARAQITSGMSGLISIGDPWTHLRVDREDAQGRSQVDVAATRALRAQTDLRYLALRDIQLDVAACATEAPGCDRRATLPDHPAAAGRAGVAVNDAFSPGLCQSPPADKNGIGFPGAAMYAPADTGFCAAMLGQTNRVWMFTVNGQLFPTITFAPNRDQLWRVANLSASVSYVLDLVDAADRAIEVPLCVISLDGVVAGSGGQRSCGDQPSKAGIAATAYLNVGFSVKRVLLMPGSRAEIFLPFATPGAAEPRSLVLRTVGLDMGSSNPRPDAQSQGDVWPQIDLARVAVPPRPDGDAPPPLRANLVRTAAAAPPVAPGTASAAAAAFAFDQSATQRAHPDCIFLPSGSSSYRRQIIFDETAPGVPSAFDPAAEYDPSGDGRGGFALGSRVVAGPIGASPGKPGLELKPAPYTMPGTHAMSMNAAPSGRHICPVLGRGEVWELVNWTTEVHNFHIHQGKFRFATAADPGAPKDLKMPVIGEDPEPGGTQPSRIMRYLSRVADPAGGVQAWHDTLPVPPRIGPNQPGRLFVFIPFAAEQQVGRFVFHCHILEHEDRGMMADIEVVRPTPRRQTSRL